MWGNYAFKISKGDKSLIPTAYLTISRRRRREYRRIVTDTKSRRLFAIFTSPEATNCFSIITLMINRENKIKRRHIFERFWGFKMSVEGGSDRQQAGFLIIAAVGFPYGNENFGRHLFNSSTSMFSISFVNS